MKNFTTTTPKGCEGCNISYKDEEACARDLIEKLPPKWKVKFSWAQILFSDVQYEINKEKKEVEVVYNQNLRYWWSDLQNEVVSKVAALK